MCDVHQRDMSPRGLEWQLSACGSGEAGFSPAAIEVPGEAYPRESGRGSPARTTGSDAGPTQPGVRGPAEGRAAVIRAEDSGRGRPAAVDRDHGAGTGARARPAPPEA